MRKHIFKQIYSLGWPKVSVLSMPKTRILISLLTLLSCYFIPMIISCVIYISLICNKKKKFKNKVSIDNNSIEMVGIVDLNNASVQGQIKTRQVKSSNSRPISNVAIVECESNGKDKLSENFFKLIDNLEHSAEDIENKFLAHENCQNPKFSFGIGNSCWSSLVEDSFFDNTKELQVTEIADVSAASHDCNTYINNLVKCHGKDIESASCLESNTKEFESHETRGRRETKMKPNCCILLKSIATEDGKNVKRGESETCSEGKLLHQNRFPLNVGMIQSGDMYLDGPFPNLIDSSADMDAKETQKDLKERRVMENSIREVDTNLDMNSICECPNTIVVSFEKLQGS